MSAYGKMKRLDSIMGKEAWRAFIVDMDRGIKIGENIGLNKVREILTNLPNLGTTSVIIPKGLVGVCYAGAGRGLGLIVNLSSTVNNKDNLLNIESIDEAIRMGADAISINMFLSNEGNPQDIRDIASFAERCDSWGIPLLVRINVKDKVPSIKRIREASVLASELGAGLISIPNIEDVGSYKDVVRSSGKPILLSVYNNTDSLEILKDSVRKSIRGGSSGIILGQEVFNILKLNDTMNEIKKIVFE